ncbi:EVOLUTIONARILY CONSERVED C-TERMINAL REGION 10 [Salix viminalis]|uniref:YTH domain-containing family protein n=1 Tax=Salix viminalis TaxID=40686 RepID=A0A9Q0V4Q7_SALVM|nr:EVOLUTIONARILY CONSERVED C-TERMINAL REGION 10 [Salix viminalis]
MDDHPSSPDYLSPPPGESLTNRDNSSMEQPLSPKDERIVSVNPSPEAAVIKRPQLSATVAPDLTIVPPPAPSPPLQLNVYDYSSHDQAMAAYAGYGNNTGVWDGYSQHLNVADGTHLSPIIYNDNQSHMYHSGYGFNPDTGHGQYSPMAPIMLDGQLYSPQQIPFSPFYHPDVPASGSLGSSELMSLESNGGNPFFGPGSDYWVHYGSFGGGNMSGALGSGSSTSPSAYPQPMGILGPYEHHVAQGSQQRPLLGYGYASSSPVGHYQHGGSYQSSSFAGGSISYAGANDRTRVGLDKGRRRDRDQDSNYSSNDPFGFDRNRGPRASKLKGKNAIDQPSSGGKGNSASSGIQLDLYNQLDFVSDYENAKFFIIKSFSEDNVHKSIKYSVWASTPHGNKKIDAAYREAKEKEGNCPVFLLFSVNASGQFCGVAEMVGPVDFEKDAEYWQQDRWNGQFPVQWHIVKDVPNSRFRHILLENNDNKPATHSRDSQEVKLEQGIEMLKIFKDHDAPTSILDDFEFYDQRERALKERKAKQQPSMKAGGPGLLADDTINQMSDFLAQSLKLDDVNKETAVREEGASLRPVMEVLPVNNCNNAVELANNSNILVSKAEDSNNHNLSPALKSKEGSGEYQD